MYFTPPPPPPLYKPITVWVHGSRTSGSYAQRFSKGFHDLQHRLFHCPDGMHCALELDNSLYMRHMAQTLSNANPEMFPFSSFYLFGWSGALDPQERRQAGIALYQELKRLIAYNKQQGINSPITLITHSHGGNVVLNMVHAYNHDPEPLEIDTAVFLACPVQHETREYATSPLFNHIYSLHSHADIMQCIDPQKMHPLIKAIRSAIAQKSFKPFQGIWTKMFGNKQPLFSERHFPTHANIRQASITWQRLRPWNNEEIALFAPYEKHAKRIAWILAKYKALGHLDFLMPRFLNQLPTLLHTLQSETKIWYCPKHPDIKLQCC
jgi:hypothetical protein